ncbi:SDR family NAD(P)-dependent oxidoreductase [Nocardia sp. NPDC051570]|uniref:SDR family NAD(P)-dependent oxidoreductase n=1 Tax=Nocardia sp. NPDC051570 TaxID=3364324 RepID=UPI003796A39B
MSEGVRRAGVSSFGISGTNAHVIIEQAPDEPVAEPEKPALRQNPILLPISAHDPDAMAAQAHNLRQLPVTDLRVLAHTLSATRSALTERAVIIASDHAEFDSALAELAHGNTTAGTVRGSARDGRLAFLFSGQGAQQAGMGSRWYAEFPVFAEHFDAAAHHLNTSLAVPLADVVFGEFTELLDNTEYTQAALFAVEVALFRLLESFGLRPDYLAGHSIGELAAAHVGGLWSLADAATVVAARGALMAALPAGGTMAAVRATEEQVRPLLGERVDIASINGPRSLVLSGDTDAVLEAAAHFGKVKALNVSHAFHSARMEPMLAEFGAVVAGVAAADPTIAIVSTLTGRLVTAAELRSPDYWVRHAREAVRFADAVTTLARRGVSTFVELGPDAVLTAMGPDCLADDDADDIVFTAVARRGRPDDTELLTAVATMHTRGATLDWTALNPNGSAARIDLPTYPFQHRRFWLDMPAMRGDAGAVGQQRIDHPLVGAAVRLAGSGGLLLTGKISTATHPMLAEHAVFGTTLLPGTAFVDLALRAGELLGTATLQELVLHAPLVLTPATAVQLQVAAADGTVEIFSRADDDAAEWIRHATGQLTETATSPHPLTAWPPPGATPIDVSGLYDSMLAQGYEYGPVFQGVQAAWRRDSEIFAELALTESAHPDAHRFGLHPALLDSALHATTLFETQGDTAPDGQVMLPFAWNGVTLHAGAATAARIRLTRDGANEVRIDLADDQGRPVASVDGYATRPVQANALAGGGNWARSMFTVDLIAPTPTLAQSDRRWVVLDDAASLGDWATVPDVVVWPVLSAGTDDVLATLRSALARTLSVLTAWLRDERYAAATLVVRTSGGLDDGPVAGLVRAAQAEGGNRIVLVEADEPAVLPAALLDYEEPELVVRDGTMLVPRLRRVQAPADAESDWGTVLITGGTGGLGALIARHLVTAHGVRSLVLASRTGPESVAAQRIRHELSDFDVALTVVACDVGDRDEVAALLAAHPVDSVVHAAGVLDDGLVDSLTPQRIDTVLRAKADAAWYLHELTAQRPLRNFVLFSSEAGTIDAAGQGNYAAANLFLEALARHRRTNGLPAVALAWGLWAEVGMGAGLTDADRARIARSGRRALDPAEGLALFDASVSGTVPTYVLTSLDLAVLRRQQDRLPAILRDLVTVPTRRVVASTTASLADRLAAAPLADRRHIVLRSVRAEIAGVLGHDGPEAIEPKRPFTELGFESLASVELRNRLTALTALRLPATLTFDYPTPAALADFVLAKLKPAESAPAGGSAPAGAVTGGGVLNTTTTELVAPVDRSWRLETVGGGSLDALVLREYPQADAQLEPGQIRISVRACGLNFRDVLIALGMYPDRDALIGSEVAGVVLDIAENVSGISPGDRVMGLVPGGIGPVAVTDHRLVTGMPEGWSFTEAAAVPVVFLTAYYALKDLAGVGPGESLLVHAATGGVGMSAVQLAKSWGLDVLATASPGKWNILRDMGFAEERIASSRTLEFEEKFMSATDTRGVDVVLDCLSGEFVDASLRLLPRGGRFLEMGKTDIRDARETAQRYPGVDYQAFDVFDAGPDRIQEMLSELAAMFEDGSLHSLPVQAWDVRRAREAMRFFSQARHTGKLVLTMPGAFDPAGTGLITGDTGPARHLVTGHEVRGLAGNADRAADDAAVRALLSRIPLSRLRESGLLEQLTALDGPDRQPVGSEPEPVSAVADTTAAIKNMDVSELVRAAMSRRGGN